MKHTLVGYTGFVGGNLAASHNFDNLYNSANINQSFAVNNGLVVYAGMPSEKFLANANPEADLAHARQALQNIRSMKPEKLVLISTVDVYPTPIGVYECSRIANENAPAYGKNRLELENWVRRDFPKALIVRLPGLFGQGLKKNFIFDMLTLSPPMLTSEKYASLSKKSSLVSEYYRPDATGFYRLTPTLTQPQKKLLKTYFSQSSFNSLNFTDSRSIFQFYDLSRLWSDISTCLDEGLSLVNFATAPIQAAFLYETIFHKPFVNHRDVPPALYDMRTRHAREISNIDDYILSVDDVMQGIISFASKFTG